LTFFITKIGGEYGVKQKGRELGEMGAEKEGRIKIRGFN
jgi:hypothetical protein